MPESYPGSSCHSDSSLRHQRNFENNGGEHSSEQFAENLANNCSNRYEEHVGENTDNNSGKRYVKRVGENHKKSQIDRSNNHHVNQFSKNQKDCRTELKDELLIFSSSLRDSRSTKYSFRATDDNDNDEEGEDDEEDHYSLFQASFNAADQENSGCHADDLGNHGNKTSGNLGDDGGVIYCSGGNHYYSGCVPTFTKTGFVLSENDVARTTSKSEKVDHNGNYTRSWPSSSSSSKFKVQVSPSTAFKVAGSENLTGDSRKLNKNMQGLVSPEAKNPTSESSTKSTADLQHEMPRKPSEAFGTLPHETERSDDKPNSAVVSFVGISTKARRRLVRDSSEHIARQRMHDGQLRTSFSRDKDSDFSRFDETSGFNETSGFTKTSGKGAAAAALVSDDEGHPRSMSHSCDSSFSKDCDSDSEYGGCAPGLAVSGAKRRDSRIALDAAEKEGNEELLRLNRKVQRLLEDMYSRLNNKEPRKSPQETEESSFSKDTEFDDSSHMDVKTSPKESRAGSSTPHIDEESSSPQGSVSPHIDPPQQGQSASPSVRESSTTLQEESHSPQAELDSVSPHSNAPQQQDPSVSQSANIEDKLKAFNLNRSSSQPVIRPHAHFEYYSDDEEDDHLLRSPRRCWTVPENELRGKRAKGKLTRGSGSPRSSQRTLHRQTSLPSAQVFHLQFKLILLGDYGVGKKKLLRALSRLNDAPEEDFGFRCTEFRPREVVELVTTCKGHQVTLRIHSTAGAEKYRSLTASYYRSAMGSILVFNTAYSDSFHNIMQWYDDMQTYVTDTKNTLLLGLNNNNTTTSTFTSEEQEVTSDRAFKMAESLQMRYLEASIDDLDLLKYGLKQMVEGFVFQTESSRRQSSNLISIASSHRGGRHDSDLRKSQFPCCT